MVGLQCSFIPPYLSIYYFFLFFSYTHTHTHTHTQAAYRAVQSAIDQGHPAVEVKTDSSYTIKGGKVAHAYNILYITLHAYCTSHSIHTVPHTPCILYITLHAYCTSHSIHTVPHTPCILYITLHAYCTSHSIHTVPHTPCILYITLHAYCTSHSMHTVHHTPCILYITLHAYCTSHSMHTVHHTPYILYPTLHAYCTSHSMHTVPHTPCILCIVSSCLAICVALLPAMTEWLPKWKQNGWKTYNSKPVKNKEDIVQLDTACQKIDVKWVSVIVHVSEREGVCVCVCCE